MGNKGLSRGFALLLLWAATAPAQTLPTSARIESIPLELTMPERYQVNEMLEPIRRVTLVAAADGFIRSMDVRLGATVRESQEIAQLDRTEASARLKMALAELKEKKALAKTITNAAGVAEAQVEAAEAGAELAQLALDRCTLRAPFAGRIVALPVCSGQYVLRGTTLAELADVSGLKTLLPVDRRSVTPGAPLTVQIEGKDVAGKVQAIMPLPAEYLALRELVTPFAAAWVVVSNAKGEFEPGSRVRPATVPLSPVAVVPKRAVKTDDSRNSEGSIVQVIRNEYVTNVPVHVLGDTGPERVQITGLLRGSDSLIVSSSVPLLPGTLVRFGEGTAGRGIEGVPPDPALGGAEAGVTAPGSSRARGRRGSETAPHGPAANRPKPAPGQPAAGSAPF
jgi:multidrug efflux pump subunit AcrA (membrane-fusion protein)